MMPMAPPQFVLDTNVLIQANLSYYAPDFHQSFWRILLEEYQSGQLASIDKVRDEIYRIDDNLSAWVRAEASGMFVSSELQSVADTFGEMVSWVQQGQFTAAAKAEFAAAADGWIAAFAREMGATVVTLEIYDADIKRKVKLPNVCRQFDVDCINTFDMLRRLGVRF